MPANDLSDGDFIIGSASKYVANLGRVFPVLLQHVHSPAAGQELRIEMDERPSFFVYVKPIDGGYRIRLPRGLALRLIALFRLLLPYFGWPKTVHFLSSPLDRFDHNQFYTPPRIAAIFEEAEDLDGLRAALSEVIFPQPLEPKAYWEDIESMTNQAIGFVLCHEVAHATGRHNELRALADQDHRLAEFGLTASDVRYATEMQADVEGTRAFLMLLVAEATTEPSEPGQFSRLATRAGFAIPALFGVWDHKKKMLSAFVGTEYPPSIFRHMLFADTAAEFMKSAPEQAEIWADREMSSWAKCVGAFHQATLDLWKSEEVPKDASLWPLGSLNYGGYAATFALGRAYDKACDTLDRFRQWEQVVKPELPAL